MPIVLPVQSQSSSSAQTVATAQIFDYLVDDKGKAIPNALVQCVLDGAVFATISPLVLIAPLQLTTTTDGNGYFSFTVVPNDNLQPANSTYTIITPSRQYQITVPSGGPWQTTAVGILVSTPVALAPAVTSLTGPLTITSGGLTVSAGGATITGGLTIVTGALTIATGGFTMAGPLTLTAAASQIIPGGTSFSVRDTGNANDNLLVSNAGNVTVRGSLTVTAGPLTVSAGGAAVTGNSTVTGTLTVTSTLTVSAGGAAITGNSTVTGTLGVTALLTAQAALTVSAGDFTVTAGRLVMAAATSKIVPGATALQLRNNADGASNVAITDAGLVTLRNALSMPAAAAGSLPTTSYGTVPVKIDDQLLGGNSALITFTNPLPTGFRHLLIEFYARGDTAATSVEVRLRFNNDSGANYDWQDTISATATTLTTGETLAATSMHIGYVSAASDTANYFGQGEAKVMQYAGATGNKLVKFHANWAETNLTGAAARFDVGGGKWRTTATAVTRIDLLPSAGNFIAGSIFTLWGIP